MSSTHKGTTKRQAKELPVGVFGDRRRAARMPVSVACQAVTDDDFCLLSDEIADLSTTGMLLRADGIPADVGESVIVSFRPPKSDLWIDVQARIVRLLNGKQPGAPGFGLELETLSPFEREVLAAALRRSQRPSKVRKSAPRKRGRRRYVDPDAVVIRPLLGVSESTATRTSLPPEVPLPVLKAEVPRSTFADEGVVLVRRRRVTRTPRSLWKDEEARTVVVAGQRRPPSSRYVRPRPNLKLQSVEEPPVMQVIVARPVRRPITATGDVAAPVIEPRTPELDLPAVRVQPAVEVEGAPPSVVVVRTLPAGTPPPPPPAAAPARVVVVGRSSPETCVSDWSCSA
ncbi:MAG: PilZ domain-containing protein [Sandaracinaceae bacterium]